MAIADVVVADVAVAVTSVVVVADTAAGVKIFAAAIFFTSAFIEEIGITCNPNTESNSGISSRSSIFCFVSWPASREN